MNKTVKILIALAGVLVLLALLNPSKNSHESAVYEKCCDINPKTCAIGGCNAFRFISYHSYGIISFGESNEMNTGSIGFCGMVFATVPDL